MFFFFLLHMSFYIFYYKTVRAIQFMVPPEIIHFNGIFHYNMGFSWDFHGITIHLNEKSRRISRRDLGLRSLRTSAMATKRGLDIWTALIKEELMENNKVSS